jgi:hypothetical protein
VLDAIAAAGVPNGTAGGDLLAKIRNAMAAVENAGYNPDTAALSPTDAAALDLFQSEGPEAIYAFGAGMSAAGILFRRLRVRTVKGLTDPLILDSQSAGRLYITPVEFNSFEENAGATNSQTARLEVNGAFAVQRPDAIFRIGI